MEGNDWFKLDSGVELVKVTTYEYYGSPEDPDDNIIRYNPGDTAVVKSKTGDLLTCIAPDGTRFCLSRWGIYTWEIKEV